MKLSVVIPARNEEGSIRESVTHLLAVTARHHIPVEVVVVDDASTDRTAEAVNAVRSAHPHVKLVANQGRHGYGMAVRLGLSHATGDAIAIMMADGSDSPEDLVGYYQKLAEGYDCVFGSRFIRGGKVIDYPVHKLVLNRLANWFIQAIFGLGFNDVTNAFKIYRRVVIDGMQPLISSHFNLTVEMALKAIIRGYSFAVVPITWTNRKTGLSKLKIKEMGSRYLFIVLYLWLEKHLSRGDYHKSNTEAQRQADLDAPVV